MRVQKYVRVAYSQAACLPACLPVCQYIGLMPTDEARQSATATAHV